jgi:hypothetical protein
LAFALLGSSSAQTQDTVPAESTWSLLAHSRTRLESLPDRNFGLGIEGESGLYQRIQLGLQWSRGEWEAELLPAWHAATGLVRSRPADRSPVDLQRAHLGWTSADGNGDSGWRLGRQSLSLGSGRILSTSNSSNQQEAFDAAQLWFGQGPWQLRALWAAQVEIRDGSAFDDVSNDARRIHGLTLTRPWSSGKTEARLEAHLLRYRLDLPTGLERRDGLGLRHSRTTGAWELELEGQLQDGHSRERSARGWLLAGSGKLPLGSGLQLQMQVDLGSGDDPSSSRNERYLPFFPSRSAFSQAAFTSYSNLRHLKTGLGWRRQQGSLQLALGLMQRMRTDDAVFLHSSSPMPGSANASNERRSGHYWQLKGGLSLSPTLKLGLEVVQFQAGPAVRAAGGSDQSYAGLSLEWTASSDLGW